MKIYKKDTPLSVDCLTKMFSVVPLKNTKNCTLYKDSIHESKKEQSVVGAFFNAICSPFQGFIKWISSLFSSSKKHSASSSPKKM